MKNPNENKAVMYCRVSSKEQEETGYSLPAQEKLIKEYSTREHNKIGKINKIFSIAESASGAKQRKVFSDMMEYVVKNKVNIILCEKVDRISRNFKEALVINDWLEEDPKREVHFVKQNLIIHHNSKSDEKFRWDIEIVLAKKYIANLSEEVKKGQNEKIAQGWFPTTPPLGYKTIGEKGHRIHVIDEDVAPYIKQMFSLYSMGNYSTASLEKKMYALGFRTRAGGKAVKSVIHKTLSNPFYYGKFVWNGELYQGRHEPIISKDEFNEVFDKMTRPNSPYNNNNMTELRGKVFCGNCSKTISWEKQKGSWYGGCKQCKARIDKKKKYILQEDLEDELLEHLTSIAPKNEKVIEVLKIALKESHGEEIERYETQFKSINNQLERIQQRMRTMYDDKLDNRITGELYDDKVKQFQEEKELLLNSLDKLESDNSEYYKVGIAIHELALRSRDIYLSKKATTEERRLLLSYAFSNIHILEGKITPEYTKSFKFLSEWMPKVNESLELQKNVVNKGQKSTFVPSCPALLQLAHKFRTQNWKKIKSELQFSQIININNKN